jgi:NADH:ubiquinone oxidoreductase subunit H
MGTSIWTVLYDNIAIVFGIVIAVALVFWVFRRLMAFFKH